MSDADRAQALLARIDEVKAQGAHGAVRAAAEELLELAGTTPAQRGLALHALAHAWIDEGQPARSAEPWERLAALEGAPGVARCEAHCARGYARAARGEHAAARDAFDAALRVRDGAPAHLGSARFHTAKSWLAEGHRRLARLELQAFLALADTYPGERAEAERLLASLS
ncbi:MAG: hypothetical protein AB7N76_22080 [Planctomycetota bacterium]